MAFADAKYGARTQPGQVKLTQWPVAKLKAGGLMRKRELPRPCKRRKSRAPPGVCGGLTKHGEGRATRPEKMGERMYGENYGVVVGNFPESAMEGPIPVATEGDVFVVPIENLELAKPAVEVPLDDIPEVPE